jgi:hypothetical protein
MVIICSSYLNHPLTFYFILFFMDLTVITDFFLNRIIKLVFLMVKCGVLLVVKERTEFLNII